MKVLGEVQCSTKVLLFTIISNSITINNDHIGSSHRGTAEMNPTRNHEIAGLIPGLDQWVKDLALL